MSLFAGRRTEQIEAGPGEGQLGQVFAADVDELAGDGKGSEPLVEMDRRIGFEDPGQHALESSCREDCQPMRE